MVETQVPSNEWAIAYYDNNKLTHIEPHGGLNTVFCSSPVLMHLITHKPRIWPMGMLRSGHQGAEPGIKHMHSGSRPCALSHCARRPDWFAWEQCMGPGELFIRHDLSWNLSGHCGLCEFGQFWPLWNFWIGFNRSVCSLKGKGPHLLLEFH